MKKALIFSIIILLFAMTTQYYLGRKKRINSKLKYLDTDPFKNKTRLHNTRRARIKNYRARRSVSGNIIKKGPYRRRISRRGKCPDGKTVKCYPLRGCKCRKKIVNRRYKRLNKTRINKKK